MNFHVLTERAGIDGFLQQGGTEKDTTDLFGALAYWLVILAALIDRVQRPGPRPRSPTCWRACCCSCRRLLVALLLLIFGAYFARFVGNAVTIYLPQRRHQPTPSCSARLAQYAIVAFVVLIAIDQLDIGGGLVQQTFLILLGRRRCLALALAFGLGGRERAATLLERWFPRRNDGIERQR